MKLLEFILDTAHAALLYPSGITRPHVACGYFSDDEQGAYQRLFFEELLVHGFQRTPFQLIFPGQTAGLIRKIEPPQDGMDEIHVRFYDDGVIAAELEYGRFSADHWREKREPSTAVLEKILETELPHLSPSVSAGIRKQFQDRDYSEDVLPKQQSLAAHPFCDYIQLLGFTPLLFALQYPTTALGALYYFSKGDYYAALEPALAVAFETPLLIFLYNTVSYKRFYKVQYPQTKS